jgi:hypothetical protein
VKEENVAKELRAQIVEDDADFYSLARKHSIDLLSPTRRWLFGTCATD